MAIALDEVDIQLLTALQEDADRTNVELARLAGLSPAATLHRVRRLKESGVIRVISAQLDPAAAGFPLQVYVTATLARHDPRSSRVFDDLIRALPQIIAADNVAGETDYLLTVVARDVAELQKVLASLATRGGQRLVTYLRLDEIKPPSRLPLAPATAAPDRPARRRRPGNAPAPGMRRRHTGCSRAHEDTQLIGKGNIGGSLGRQVDRGSATTSDPVTEPGTRPAAASPETGPGGAPVLGIDAALQDADVVARWRCPARSWPDVVSEHSAALAGTVGDRRREPDRRAGVRQPGADRRCRPLGPVRARVQHAGLGELRQPAARRDTCSSRRAPRSPAGRPRSVITAVGLEPAFVGDQGATADRRRPAAPVVRAGQAERRATAGSRCAWSQET